MASTGHWLQLLLNIYMIYSNDDTDKARRQKNYILTVYLVPILTILIGCLSIHFIVPHFHLDKADKRTAYICSFMIGIVIWFVNKHKWLPLPDATHFRISKEETTAMKISSSENMNEPESYAAEFRYSRSEKGLVLICGLVTLLYGLYKISRTSVIFPLLICALGLFLIIPAYKGFIDRTPKLKLSKKGLWTSQLGFRRWDSIAKAKIKEEIVGRVTELFLVIYLKNGKFENSDYPDQKLSLKDIKDKDTIEDLLFKLSNKKESV